MGISGVYNSHFQVTTYWILDHTIMDADVNNAADIGVGKLNHTALLTDNNSGTISWICAAGSASAGAAGGITTGAGVGSNNVGGTLTLTAGNSVGSGVGAKVDINAGATVTGTGGAVEITAGGGGTSGAGGGIDIDAGAGGTTGNGGNVDITTGGATTGNSGAMTLSTATPGTLGDAGAVNLTGGAGKGATNTGGNVVLTAGDSITTGVGAKVDINGGAGGNDGVGGAIEITAGAAGGGNRAGGAIDIDAGDGQGSEPGGAVLINAGAAGATGDGGPVTITSGTVTSGTGGAISLTASPGVAATNVGGTITLTAGAGVTSGNGGDIQLTPGDSPSGTAGSVLVGANTAGHDVKLFGATSGAYALWDASADDLLLVGAATLNLSSATLNVTDNDVSLINMGSYDTALASTATPTANTFGTSLHISHATNAGSGMWLAGSYEKISVITNAQGNNSIVTSMVRMDIQQAIAAAYGIQSHVKFTAGTAQDVSSEVIAVSAQIYGECAAGTGLHWGVKSDLRATSTPTARGTSATFFGVTTVSAGDIVYLENLTGATVQDAIYIHNVGTMTNGIYMVGSITNGINMPVTFAGSAINLQGATPVLTDDDLSLVRIGGYDNPLAITGELTDNIFLQSIHVSLAEDPDADTWIAPLYLKFAATTESQSHTQAVSCMVRADVQQAIKSMYGIQSHVKCTSPGDTSSEIIGVSAQIYGTHAGSGLHWGVKSDLRHTGCPSGAGHTSACYFGVGTVSCSCGVYLEPLGSTTMYSGIYLHAAGDMTNCIETNGEANMTYFLKATAAAGPLAYNASFSGQSGAEPDASIKVDIGGHDLYIYCFPTAVS